MLMLVIKLSLVIKSFFMKLYYNRLPRRGEAFNDTLCLIQLIQNIYNTGFLFLILPKRIKKNYLLFYSLKRLFRGTWKVTKSVHRPFHSIPSIHLTHIVSNPFSNFSSCIHWEVRPQYWLKQRGRFSFNFSTEIHVASFKYFILSAAFVKQL